MQQIHIHVHIYSKRIKIIKKQSMFIIKKQTMLINEKYHLIEIQSYKNNDIKENCWQKPPVTSYYIQRLYPISQDHLLCYKTRMFSSTLYTSWVVVISSPQIFNHIHNWSFCQVESDFSQARYKVPSHISNTIVSQR